MRSQRSASAVSSSSSRTVRLRRFPEASTRNSAGLISRSPTRTTSSLTAASIAATLSGKCRMSVTCEFPPCENAVNAHRTGRCSPARHVHSRRMSELRLAILDSDSGFVRVLVKRAGDLGWQYRRLEAPPRTEEFIAMRVNALVVDLALLGQGAWDFLERVSDALPGLGIVVCTGRSTVSQRVRGLRLGADDWVTKPCHPEEVLARVEAVVRRRKRASARVDSGPLVAGELEIRADQFQAFVRSTSVDLTRREFEVLQLLAQAEGKVLQREEIYQAVWGYAMAHGDRSVDVFIRKVRQKLEKASPDWSYIHTHFGVGYRFQPERPGGPDEAAAFEASLREERPAPAPHSADELPPDPDSAGDASGPV